MTLVATGIGAVNTAHALTCYLQGQRRGGSSRSAWAGRIHRASQRRGLGLGQRGKLRRFGSEDTGRLAGRRTDRHPSAGARRSYYNCFPIDEQWVQRAAAALPGAYIGPFVTCRNARAPTNWGWKGGGALGPCAKTWRARPPRTYPPIRSAFCRVARHQQHRRAAYAGAMGSVRSRC